jgi:GMP synthase-like glutamine amidotransferase
MRSQKDIYWRRNYESWNIFNVILMISPRVLIIQNDETETLGLYEENLRQRKVPHQVFHAYKMGAEGSFPSLDCFDAFIVGPTPISANDYHRHGFLSVEWEFLGGIIESGKPCLGICCGAQLLAKHLGAEVLKSPEKEVGGYEVQLTEDGGADLLFSGFPDEFPVFQWHSDMFEVPPGGQVLVEGDPCPIQAFGWGRVRGVIFHLEIDRFEAGRWANAYPNELDAVGKTRQRVIEECVEREPVMRVLAQRLIDNFLGKVVNQAVS